MKPRLLFTLAAAASAVLIACRQEKGKLSAPTSSAVSIRGQAFIRLQNGESIKLGLVPILLIDSNASVRFLKTSTEHFRSQWKPNVDRSTSLSTQIDELSAKIASVDRERYEVRVNLAELRGKTDLAVARLTEVWRKLSPLQQSNAQQTILKFKADQEPLVAKEAALHSRYDSLGEEKRTMEGTLDHLRTERKALEKHDYFASWTPVVLANAVTDADGKFTITVPDTRGRYFIYAESSRKLLNKEEHYRWLVPVSATELNLHNGNLFSAALITGASPTPETEEE
jgi:hypothetical protein